MWSAHRKNVSLLIIGSSLGFLAAVAAGAVASGEGVRPAQGLSKEGGDKAVDLALAADPARRTPVVDAVQQVAPAVVSITTESASNDPFARFYGRRTTSGEGSGVVIDTDGVVLTNAHVVERAVRITATFADQRSFEAQVVGIAPELDLAVLRLEGATGLSAAPIGTSQGLLLGEPVIAIGNPFGLGHTVTTGVISAVSRPLETEARVYQDFIQTDASINPGNSGGPLLDVHGRLVGINTAIRADAEGIGFAIPVDRAMKVARDLLDHGSVQIPWLGVDLQDVAINSSTKRSTAPRVVRSHRDGPLRSGDVIRAINGRETQGRSDLNAYLAGLKAEAPVNLEVLREGTTVVLTVSPQELSADLVEAAITVGLGVELGALDQRYRVPGVTVTRVAPQGSLGRLGLAPGDRICAVDGQAVRSAEDLRAALTRAKSAHKGEALFTVARGNSLGRVTLQI